MKKIMTKTLSVMLCIAFSGLQMSIAGGLTGGNFAGADVLSGSKIQGHTAGLDAVTVKSAKEVDLHFGGNTRIDWAKLNVSKNEILNFKNGNFGVLNNVVGTSISKVAGTITAQNGKVIISNPNGILFQGGKFESLGGLVLTTKNLVDATGLKDSDFAGNYTNTAYLNGIDLSAVGSQEAGVFGVVALANDGDVKTNIISPEFNIISNGAMIDGAVIASPNAGGVVLVTADGANFVSNMSKTLSADDGSSKTIQFEKTYNVAMANSAITTQGGQVEFVSGSSTLIDNPSVEGDLKLTSPGFNKVRNGGIIRGNVDLTSKQAHSYLNEIDGTPSGAGRIIITGNLTENNKTGAYINGVDINGDSDITANHFDIKNSSLYGNLTLTDTAYNDNTKVFLTNDTIGRTLNVNSKDRAEFKDVTVLGTSDVKMGSLILNHVSFMGKSDIVTNGYTRVYGNSYFGNDLSVTASEVNLGFYTENGYNTQGTMTVLGDFVANSTLHIGFSDIINANNITLNSTNGSILNSHSANWGDGELHANGVLTINANNGSVISLNGDVVSGRTTSDYYDVMTLKEVSDLDDVSQLKESVNSFKDNNVGRIYVSADSANVSADGRVLMSLDVANDAQIKTNGNSSGYVNGVKTGGSRGYVSLSGNVGGNLTASSDKSFVRVGAAKVNSANDVTEVGGNVDISGTGIVFRNANVAGNFKAKDTKFDDLEVSVFNSNIKGNIDIVAEDEIILSNVKGQDADKTVELTANKNYVWLENVELNDTTVNTPISFTRISGNSKINGDLNIDANQITFGRYDANAVLSDGQKLVVDGDINAKANHTIAYSSDITADNMTFTSLSSSLVQANTDNIKGSLTTDSLTINAQYGGAVALDASSKNSASADAYPTYYESVIAPDFVPNGKGAAEFGSINVNTKTAGATLKINDGAGIANIKVDDNVNNVVVTNNGANNIMDLKLTAKNADVKVSDLTAMKDTAESAANGTMDHTGNIVIDTENGSVTIGNVLAQTDLIVLAENGTITQTGKLAADYDSTNNIAHENGVGSLILKADHDLGIDTTAYGALTGANIELSVNTGDIVTSHLEAVGFEYNPTTDKDATADGLTKGDIIVTTGNGKVELSDVHGTHDVIINSTKSVTLNDVVADANVGAGKETEQNGRGQLIVNAKDDVVGTKIGGGNVIITTDKDITVSDVVSHRNFPVDDGRTPVAKTGATANNENVGGNIILTSNQGNITAGDVKGATNVEIYAENGGLTQTGDLLADYNHPNNGHDTMVGDDNFDNGIGQLIIKTKDSIDIGGDKGTVRGGDIIVTSTNGDVTADGLTVIGNEPKSDDNFLSNNNGDIIITADGNATVTNSTALRDVTITATNGDATVKNVVADSDNNTQGSLNIHAGGNADVNNATGSEIEIIADNGNVIVHEVHANGGDDSTNRGNGDNDKNNPDAEALDGNGNFIGTGDLKISAENGDVYMDSTVDAIHDVVVNLGDNSELHLSDVSTIKGNPNYPADSDRDTYGDFIINGGRIVIDPTIPTIDNEAERTMNNLIQNGVDTTIAQSFTPIAFAADDDDDDNIGAKRIAKVVFKTPETGVVTITDVLKKMK